MRVRRTFQAESPRMSEFIELVLRDRRSLETVLAHLIAKHKRSPSAGLARMIEGIEAEIIQRQSLIGGAGGRRFPTLNPIGQRVEAVGER
jgi:hypothetical protein